MIGHREEPVRLVLELPERPSLNRMIDLAKERAIVR